jgi:DNA topoisomerase-1
MSKKLVLVESPKKAKIISQILGKDYIVLATLGHILDLPNKQLGVDLNTFEGEFVPNSKSKKIIREILSKSKEVEEVFLATDPDREGEAIAKQLEDFIQKQNKKIYRIKFYEITEKEILSKIKNKIQVNYNLVESQIARRILDRLFGYLISPYLWKYLNSKNLSSGRVQSVVLKWIVEREKEILEFKSKEYFEISSKMEIEGEEFDFKLVTENPIDSLKELDSILKKLMNDSHFSIDSGEVSYKKQIEIKELEKKEIIQFPPKPYSTSSLQKDAFNVLKFSAQKTNKIAQGLYEGKNNSGGFITYIRTDSNRISEDSKLAAREYIKEKFGKETIGYKNKESKINKNSFDAHEAIRPTLPLRNLESLNLLLKNDELKLYELIFNRYIASQMKEAIYEQISIQTELNGYLFQAKKKFLLQKGYLELTQKNAILNPPPKITKDSKIKVQSINWEKKFTEPPPRYTESSIIEKMEKTGIGRPSTYASILVTLFKRNYIQNLGKSLQALDLGGSVIELLELKFHNLLKNEFTKKMEETLDSIAEGNQDKKSFLKNFYLEIKNELDKKENWSKKNTSKEYCPNCKSVLYTKNTSKGVKYHICSNFPICDYMKYI